MSTGPTGPQNEAPSPEQQYRQRLEDQWEIDQQFGRKKSAELERLELLERGDPESRRKLERLGDRPPEGRGPF
jgi:hypothetical protein